MTDSWMERAKTLMQSRGISQEKIAASLSCTRGAIGHYLNGRRSPSLRQLEQLAEVLGTDPGWLVFGKIYKGIGEGNAGYMYAEATIPLAAEIRPSGSHTCPGALSPPSAAANAYAVLINTNSYEPRIHAGEAVLVDSGKEPTAGDEVIIHYRDRVIELHTLLKAEMDCIVVDSLVGEKRVRTLQKNDYQTMHKLAAIFRPSHKS